MKDTETLESPIDTDDLRLSRTESNHDHSLTYLEGLERNEYLNYNPLRRLGLIGIHLVDRTVHSHLGILSPSIAKANFYIETVLLNCMILVSTVSVCVQTVDDYDPHRHVHLRFRWLVFDHICVAMFSLEFALRMWSASMKGQFWQRWKEPMHWIDVLAIAPFYAEQMMHYNGFDLRFLRAARLVRVTAAAKSVRFGNLTDIIHDIVKSSMAALTIPLYFMALAVIVLSSILYYAEVGKEQCCETIISKFGLSEPFLESCVSPTKPATCTVEQGACCHVQDKNSTKVVYRILYNGDVASGSFESIPQAMWWCVVTFTTVGYGDKFPVTAVGQYINTFAMFLGVFFLAMPVAIIGDSFEAAWERVQFKRKSENAKRMLLSGRWHPNLKRLHQVKFDIDAHINCIKDRVKIFGADRPNCEQAVWQHAMDTLSFFQGDFENVRDYYSVDPELLRMALEDPDDVLLQQKVEAHFRKQSVENPLADAQNSPVERTTSSSSVTNTTSYTMDI